MPDINFLTNELMTFWRAEGLKINPPTTEHQLREAEDRLKIEIPTELETFYRLTNGFDDMDKEFFRFCPIEELDSLASIYREHRTHTNFDHHIVFADYLMWCWGLFNLFGWRRE